MPAAAIWQGVSVLDDACQVNFAVSTDVAPRVCTSSSYKAARLATLATAGANLCAENIAVQYIAEFS
jgi:hypothetical protein